MDKKFLTYTLALTTSFLLIQWWFEEDPRGQFSGHKQVENIEVVPQTPTQVMAAPRSCVLLENDYQQLVFDIESGSLAEINLPFRTGSNQKSKVLPTEIDVALAENPNYNLYPSPKSCLSTGDKNPGGYFPLLRRTIYPPSQGERSHAPYLPATKDGYYALNILQQSSMQGLGSYALQSSSSSHVTFALEKDGLQIIKTFSLPQTPDDAPYTFDLAIDITGNSNGLVLTAGVIEADLVSGNAHPSLKFRPIGTNTNKVTSLKLPKNITTYPYSPPDWVCSSNGFFSLIIDPSHDTLCPGFAIMEVPGHVVETRLVELHKENQKYPPTKFPGYTTSLSLESGSHRKKFRIFAGPMDRPLLTKLENHFLQEDSGYHPRYDDCQKSTSWFSFLSEPFANFLYVIMTMFHWMTSSWGLSIILLTVVLRIILYPLNNASIKSTIRMQAIAPELALIQKKYKNEPQKQQQEILKLYQKHGFNPFGGCLPVLIQLPFLIGMYDLLNSSFELRGVPFIPHWIDNLTSPDVLFSWNYSLPFIGSDFHLLPILLAVVMYVQQNYFGATTPLEDTQKTQQKTVGNLMVFLFALLFYHFPSGLNIYWLSSMLLGILQQWYTAKRFKPFAPS